tara:strand:- start:1272 stop:3671 length:2400 start_codon:yes stop_codon:yes gene_type:complete
MKIPIRILIGNIPEPADNETWGDVIDSWESYAVAWNASNNLDVDVTQTPILDMFGDEGVSIKSVVKDMSDPKKLFTDFSKTFTVPASKKNNRIFKHNYNIDINNGIDSRELIPAKIIMNNTTYKVGNIRIDGARMANGVAMHYKITFIGKLSELARQIGKDRLNDLDFTSLYDDSFDFLSEMQNQTARDLMFPLASRKARYIADSATAATGIEGARNIAYSGGTNAVGYGIREEDIIGALSVGAILDKIQTRYNFNFTGVLESDYIRELYLWLHQTDKTRSGSLNSTIANNYTLSAGNIPDFQLISNGFVFNATEETQELGQDRKYEIRVKGVFNTTATVKLKLGGQVVREISASNTYTENFRVLGNRNDAIFQVEVESEGNPSVDITVQITGSNREYTPAQVGNHIFKSWTYSPLISGFLEADAAVGTANTYDAQKNLPTMTIMEFLTSIFKQFNIIAEVDSDLNISTKHYDHFMSEGSVKDITKYVDVTGYDINKPNLYSSLLMGFEEPVLALEEGYKAVNGRNYGEIRYELIGEEGVKLSGGAYDLKIKNQRSPIEPIDDLDDGSDFRVCYTLFSDVGGSEQSIKPMFTYICKPDTLTGSVSQLAFDTVSTVSSSSVYTMPSNVHQVGLQTPVGLYSSVGLYFGEELSEYRYAFNMFGNGLWHSFYRGTTALMFDEDKRKVKLTAHIPQSQLINLKLSDTLLISNKFYNINSLETNYLSGVTKLDLTLVGNSKLEHFDTKTRNIDNESLTESIYFTYVDASTGLITRYLLAANTDVDINMVGSVIGRSGDFVETFA